VSEGEPDWLTWATRSAASALEAPGVLGIWAGAWSPEIGARIPDQAEVIIRTDQDHSGRAYAQKVAATLVDRLSVRQLVGGRG